MESKDTDVIRTETKKKPIGQLYQGICSLLSRYYLYIDGDPKKKIPSGSDCIGTRWEALLQVGGSARIASVSHREFGAPLGGSNAVCLAAGFTAASIPSKHYEAAVVTEHLAAL